MGVRLPPPVPSDRREPEMEHESACRIVWNILKGMPIEVFDEDEGSIWENDTYELVRPRTEGDYEGTRAIGSANIVTALNMINQKLVINNVADENVKNTADQSFELFSKVMDELQEKKLIRKIPTKVRSTFKLIEGTNFTHR